MIAKPVPAGASNATDWGIGLLLALIAAVISWSGSGHTVAAMAVPLDAAPMGYDSLWFGSDAGNVFDDITRADQEQSHTEQHPLAALLWRAPVRAYLRLAPLADPVRVIRASLAVAAALWTGLLFACLRLLGCRRWDALVFTVVALTSATAFFWFATPDRFLFGSITIVAVTALVVASRKPARPLPSVAAIVVSAAFTITDVMFGLAACLVLQPLRRVVGIVLGAAGVLLILRCLQWVIYPTSEILPRDRSYEDHLQRPGMATAGAVASDLLLHGMVMPPVVVARDEWVIPYRTQQVPYLSTQRSSVLAGRAAGVVAAAAWTALLVVGVWSLGRDHRRPELRFYLVLVLAGQFALHLVFAPRFAFLFTPHYFPLLLVIAAHGTLTRARPVVVALALVLAGAAAVSNAEQRSRSWTMIREIAPEAAPWQR